MDQSYLFWDFFCLPAFRLCDLFFEISHGASQGDPLSSLLYTLVAEVIGAAIRNCKDIRGVRLPGSSEESKIGQYADDGDLTLVDDFSIANAFEIICIYEKGSG